MIGSSKVEQVDEFCYLGSMITQDNRCNREIRRIVLAKKAFNNKYNMLACKHLDKEVRKEFAKTFVWSTLLYGSESWTISKRERKQLEGVEMWIWRRMTHTRWIDRKTNGEVLREIGEQRNLMEAMERRKIKYIGHVIRHNKFLAEILEWKILGKKGKGRPRKKYIEEIKSRMVFRSYVDLKRAAEDRNIWQQRQGIAFRNR